MAAPRLRQLVFASAQVEDIAQLQAVLGLGEPFTDPGVAEFGLTNGVFALGDQFLEVVVPTQDATAAGRFLQRSHGQGGYMAIFQCANIDALRARADAANIRRVWNVDLPDIRASHMHPADIGAAIVSVDEARPAGSWRWGGPDWSARSAQGALLGADLISPDPQALARRWAELLDLTPQQIGDKWRFELADAAITVSPGANERLTAFHIRINDPVGALQRAASAGLRCFEHGFHMIGVDVCLVLD